jgi:hypothetical protein
MGDLRGFRVESGHGCKEPHFYIPLVINTTTMQTASPISHALSPRSLRAKVNFRLKSAGLVAAYALPPSPPVRG